MLLPPVRVLLPPVRVLVPELVRVLLVRPVRATVSRVWCRGKEALSGTRGLPVIRRLTPIHRDVHVRFAKTKAAPPFE